MSNNFFNKKQEQHVSTVIVLVWFVPQAKRKKINYNLFRWRKRGSDCIHTKTPLAFRSVSQGEQTRRSTMLWVNKANKWIMFFSLFFSSHLKDQDRHNVSFNTYRVRASVKKHMFSMLDMSGVFMLCFDWNYYFALHNHIWKCGKLLKTAPPLVTSIIYLVFICNMNTKLIWCAS